MFANVNKHFYLLVYTCNLVIKNISRQIIFMQNQVEMLNTVIVTSLDVFLLFMNKKLLAVLLM